MQRVSSFLLSAASLSADISQRASMQEIFKSSSARYLDAADAPPSASGAFFSSENSAADIVKLYAGKAIFLSHAAEIRPRAALPAFCGK